MNPDKLFDYLEGKLPEGERAHLEEQIAQDPQLQKEFAAARRIQSSMRGGRREVMLPDDAVQAERGSRMALRVGIAFLVLIALNVGFGLFFIARHEATNPNRKLLEDQMRDQLSKSLQQATHGALTPPPLDLDDLIIPAPPGGMSARADEVVALAQRLGGSGTKELPDAHEIGVLVDVPAARETEFRATINALSGASASPGLASQPPPPEGSDKKRFVVHVRENVPAESH